MKYNLVIVLLTIVLFSGADCEFNGKLKDNANEPFFKIQSINYGNNGEVCFMNIYFSKSVDDTIPAMADAGLEGSLLGNITLTDFYFSVGSAGDTSLLEITWPTSNEPSSGETVTVTLNISQFVSLDGYTLSPDTYGNPFTITW